MLAHSLKLQVEGIEYQDLFSSDGLQRLDTAFLNTLQAFDASVHDHLLVYRTNPQQFSAEQVSDLIIHVAPVLEAFVAQLFAIDSEVSELFKASAAHNPVFEFKEWFILKQARRRISKKTEDNTFAALDDWLNDAMPGQSDDRELAIATWGLELLIDEQANKAQIDQLIDWCVAAMTEPMGMAATRHWPMFRLPQRLDYDQLVPLEHVQNSPIDSLAAPDHALRQRDGFALTDTRMSARATMNEIHYCVYCHKNQGDFCSKGFPVKKNRPELGLKTNPLGEVQTGCPLEEKISEMHWLKRSGYSIGALAVVMIDNPMCAVTGHRICNDCMKGCIYQKQDPVNIPEVETRTLTDVLALPWGVEIYDLLTRWNPLRHDQYRAKPYNGKKVLVMGMGPAGFTLAHHLLMEGFAVVGVDGLKLEPLQDDLTLPIRDFESIAEPLDDRVMAGFGGVAEYGITVRWDKNFLKLIYLTLLRRPYFSVYGGVRFGGTITVEDAWALGFDHLAIAVGAGLPRELHIKNSMAPGMRQANDFLMALQLTGAAKKNSLANLQVRLPAVVIGGGLTGVDAATEVQAYYIAQVEKTLARYERLVDVFGQTRVHEQFPEQEFNILNEFLVHGRAVRKERELAASERREPNFIEMLRSWGGVTIVYRRRLKDSPAYKRNHEEVIKAMEEGIFYSENLEPVAARLDQYGHVEALVCRSRIVDEHGQWVQSDQEQVIEAKAILVATGAKPNVAYEFEHRGTFHREGLEYKAYDEKDGRLQIVHPMNHCKTEQFGPFTSYEHDQYRVSFLGDTHPVFHGSVVKAIASAKRIYPKIVSSFGNSLETIGQDQEYQNFARQIREQFSATVLSIKRHTQAVIEVTIKAPLAAKNFSPGQFYRVQNYEVLAPIVGDTRLQSEAMAMIGAGVDSDAGTISLMVMEFGASSRLFATLKVGDPISVMGPTGVRTKIPVDHETVMVVGGRYGAAHIRSVGPAMRKAGNKVLYIAGFTNREEVYCQDELEACADVIVWVTEVGEPIEARRGQDRSATGPFMEVLLQYARGELEPGPNPPTIPLETVDRVLVVGTKRLIGMMQQARQNELAEYYVKKPEFIASIYGPMQCMLKGVCAQCLQWQIDPKTGERTKAVYACSWQDQPLDIVDVDNLNERLAQNRCQELLTNLWLDYLFAHHEVERV